MGGSAEVAKCLGFLGLPQHHIFSSLKQQKCFLSQFQRPELPNQSVCGVCSPRRGSEAECSLPLSRLLDRGRQSLASHG